MAFDIGGLLGGVGSIISATGNIVTGYQVGKVGKKYKKKFYLLQAQAQQAETEAQKQLIEIEKEKAINELITESDAEKRKTEVLENYLAFQGSEKAGTSQKIPAGTMVMAIAGLGILMLHKKKKGFK